MPEPVWASLVRRKGDRLAHAIAARIHAKRQAAAAEAYQIELRLATQAMRRGPQISPHNDLGAEVMWEMSDYSATYLHTDKEAVAEGGWQSDDYMNFWLKRNERNQRKTAMHANRKGWTPEVEASAEYLGHLKLQRLTLASQIITDAASESPHADAQSRLVEAAASAPQPTIHLS
jgi:hypothetical protein